MLGNEKLTSWSQALHKDRVAEIEKQLAPKLHCTGYINHDSPVELRKRIVEHGDMLDLLAEACGCYFDVEYAKPKHMVLKKRPPEKKAKK